MRSALVRLSCASARGRVCTRWRQGAASVRAQAFARELATASEADLGASEAADPAEEIPVDTDVDEAGSASAAVTSLEPRLASVTSVLNVLDKSGLVPWAVYSALNNVKSELLTTRGSITAAVLDDILNHAKQEPDRIKRNAAAFGTRVHDAVDKAIQSGHLAGGGEGFDLARSTALSALGTAADSASRNCVESFVAWARDCGLGLDAAGDTFVTWPALGFRGAFDAIGWTDDGSAVLIDIKTSSRIHGSYGLQLSAYTHAFAAAREMAAAAAACEVLGAGPADRTSAADGGNFADEGLVSPARHRYMWHPVWGSGLVCVPESKASEARWGALRPSLQAWGLSPPEGASPDWVPTPSAARGEAVPEPVARAVVVAACGQLPPGRSDASSTEAVKARAAMFLRPVSSVQCAVVRLQRRPGAPAEVQVGAGLGNAWAAFKAALFLRRALEGDREAGLLQAPGTAETAGNAQGRCHSPQG